MSWLAHPGRTVQFSAAGAVALASVLTALCISAQGQLERSSALVDSLKVQLASAEVNVPQMKQGAASDFAVTLPKRAEADAVVRRLQRASSAQGVTFVSVNASVREPSPQTLGRTELALVLRGPYPQVKAVLAEGTDQPGAVLQRLVLRRNTSPNDVEAHASVLLLTRPTSALRSQF